MVDVVCLRNDVMRAKLTYALLEKIYALIIGSLGVVSAPPSFEWIIVVKGEKWIPLPDFSPLPSSPE